MGLLRVSTLLESILLRHSAGRSASRPVAVEVGKFLAHAQLGGDA